MMLSVLWERDCRRKQGLQSQLVIVGMYIEAGDRGTLGKEEGRNLDPRSQLEPEGEGVQIQGNCAQWASIQMMTGRARRTGARGVGTGGKSQRWQQSGIQAGKLNCSLPICEIRTSGKKIFIVLLVKAAAKTVIILFFFFKVVNHFRF